MAGVPMCASFLQALSALLTLAFRILWPIAADQPVNAIHLTDHIGAAYELIEVRNGAGLGPILRNGKTPTGTLDAVKEEMRDVLHRAFGKDGEKKREKVRELRNTLQAAWSEGGIAKKEVEAMLDEL